MKTSNLAALVVVYNKSCQDSPTCQCLQSAPVNVQVLVYDNSTSDFGNRTFCEEKGWIYLGGNGNVGLSRAYNQTVDYLKQTLFAGSLCLFDDDTHLEPAYFAAIANANWGRKKIFVPLIISSGALISPCVRTKHYRSRLFETPQQALAYRGRDLSAINSGMAIHISVFENYRYDEHIFLDGIDHKFMEDMHKKGVGIGCVDCRCNHDFSGSAKPPAKAALIRFSIYVKDTRYILRGRPCIYFSVVGRRALHLTWQYKSLQFLKILLTGGNAPEKNA